VCGGGSFGRPKEALSDRKTGLGGPSGPDEVSAADAYDEYLRKNAGMDPASADSMRKKISDPRAAAAEDD
jgi:hypothetical protein